MAKRSKSTPKSPEPPVSSKKKFDSTIILRIDSRGVELLEKAKRQTGHDVATKAIIRSMEIVTGHYKDVVAKNHELTRELAKLREWQTNLAKVLLERNRYTKQLDSILESIPKPEGKKYIWEDDDLDDPDDRADEDPDDMDDDDPDDENYGFSNRESID